MQVVYYVATSLDGFIAAPDGSVAFLAPFEEAGIDTGYEAFYREVDSVVMGRRTYDQVLGFGPWPYAGKPTWILTHHGEGVEHPEAVAFTEGPAALVSHAGERGLKRLWLVGGSVAATSFLRAGLVHELWVTTVPVLLGRGIPLFTLPGLDEALPLELLESVPRDRGLQSLRYRCPPLPSVPSPPPEPSPTRSRPRNRPSARSLTGRTLYAYLEDPHPSEDTLQELRDALDLLVEEHAWQVRKPFLVSQRVEDDPLRDAGRPPEWDFGLQLHLPDAGQEPAGYVADLEALLRGLQQLRAETGLSWVVGVFDRAGSYAEELAYLDRAEPDLDKLWSALGVAPASTDGSQEQ